MAVLAGFEGFAEFPDFQRDYRSPELFPTFANRVMTPRRDSYETYVRALGLHDARPETLEVLARTLGTRATDVVQLLPVPTVDEHGILSIYFLVHGTRHLDPDARRLARVRHGDVLHLAPESDNPASPVAVLVGRTPEPTAGTAIGWVPEAFAPLIRQLLSTGAAVRAVAEQVNPPSGSHLPDHMLRLLVRLDAVVPPGFDVEQALPA